MEVALIVHARLEVLAQYQFGRILPPLEVWHLMLGFLCRRDWAPS